MGVSDNGNDPVALTQTRCPGPRVQGSDDDFVTRVVPNSASVETEFDVVGVRACERAGPVNSIKRVKGSSTNVTILEDGGGEDHLGQKSLLWSIFRLGE
jgi:hypothetical protein